MAKNYAKDVYVHYNFNKNEIRDFLIQNDNYNNVPTPASGEDKGLIYYDTILDRILVWNGDCWKIVKYLDDRDLTSRENILIEDIWMQATLIPDNLTAANASDIVEEVICLALTHIPGTYTFTSPLLVDIIDHELYGAFYKPTLQANNGFAIPDDFNDWKIEGNTVTFYKGFKNNLGIFIGPTLPPKISFWKYTGLKGSLNFIGGQTNILEFNPTVLPYNEIALPPAVTGSTVLSVTVNGVLIYDYTIVEILGVNTLIIDEVEICYDIETDDTIRVETNAS